MDIPLKKLHYSFKKKPLLIGGRAMEFYNLRKSGPDIDLVADKVDIENLIKLYPNKLKNLWGDLGVCPEEFEIWKTVNFFDYDFLKGGSSELENILVISEEKLLFMKTLVIGKEKYFKDVKLIVEDIINKQKTKFDKITNENNKILNGVEFEYIEQSGSTLE